MSKTLIEQYYHNLERAVQFGKTTNESSIKYHFWNLLNDYARKQNYEVITEVSCMGTKGKPVRPDGILKNLFGLDIGLWESKDESDSLDEEITTKRQKGYPFTNILFEDSQTAVLIQHGEEVMRTPIRNADKLHELISLFIGFKSETITKFEEALENFKADIPKIVETLRKKIDELGKQKPAFQKANRAFLELCQAEINPNVTDADIREMMIQHILTSDIFTKIFDDPDFHRHNNIAHELEKLIGLLFTHSERKNLLLQIEHYYDTINAAAAGIADHHEKQKFLKVLYENFYKVYNPKAADRLGVVYTPNEIVKFMIESTDALLEKHFGKTLASKGVEILDPATGTGTFIAALIDHLPKQQLLYKYQHEIHANEVAILPYYIANLNIEYTFKQRMGRYEEFKNLCFVDTLDNISALDYEGKQTTMFALSSENAERIKRQNERKISVIIGNPPYNANQLNENENNKNREYPYIDKRIKETFIAKSTAQKTKVYDMYARFYRWAMDRIDKNGVICFITNNSFINARAFDGFRKCVEEEFDFAYIIDLGGNIRELSGRDGIWMNEEHTIFGVAAAVGIAIMFLVKKEAKQKSKCSINYIHPCDIRATRREKIEYLQSHKFGDIPFERITPDENGNWINLADTDFETLLPLANKQTKLAKTKAQENAVFKLFSLGVVTARDEWVYDFDKTNLEKKVKFLIQTYNRDVERLHGRSSVVDNLNYEIKWTRAVKNDLKKGKKYKFDQAKIIDSLYRPFCKRKLYFSKELNEMQYQQNLIFPIGEKEKSNPTICFLSIISSFQLSALVTNNVFDYCLLKSGNGATQCLPFYRYTESGERVENITDWGLEQFRAHYGERKIQKEDIFHYVYAVLHHPAYRKKYELDLKREFPRVPFYDDFWKWAAWGKRLMDLHLNYESVEPFGLKRMELPDEKVPKKLKARLKANKEKGIIEIDEQTTLSGVPKEAWDYKLGNRSALEWILDQYKETKPKDKTIAEKFHTYRFADYKEQVIDLLQRVATVSVETVKIMREMEESNKSGASFVENQLSSGDMQDENLSDRTA